jgi:hypothetical protein
MPFWVMLQFVAANDVQGGSGLCTATAQDSGLAGSCQSL